MLLDILQWININKDIFLYNLELWIKIKSMLYFMKLLIYYHNTFMHLTWIKYTKINIKEVQKFVDIHKDKLTPIL